MEHSITLQHDRKSEIQKKTESNLYWIVHTPTGQRKLQLNEKRKETEEMCETLTVLIRVCWSVSIANVCFN